MKKLFIYLFMLLIVSVLVLPLVTTFDHFLTRLANNIGGVQLVQRYIVPHEAKIIAVILKPLGFRVMPMPNGIYVNEVLVTIWWSCIGWQSLLLILLSLWPGLSKGFTLTSKMETLVLAVLGFFFLTVIRLTTVSVVGGLWGALPALVYHDYFAATLLTFIFLFFFWWFCYGYILEEKTV